MRLSRKSSVMLRSLPFERRRSSIFTVLTLGAATMLRAQSPAPASADPSDLKLEEPSLEFSPAESMSTESPDDTEAMQGRLRMEPTISIEGLHMPAVEINGTHQTPQA